MYHIDALDGLGAWSFIELSMFLLDLLTMEA
jgi:hypothetical protein